MRKTWGILSILVVVVLLTTVKNPNFLGAGNLRNTLQWTSLYSILSIGVAFVNGRAYITQDFGVTCQL